MGHGFVPEITNPTPPQPRPRPIEPIKENKESNEAFTFIYYGTTLTVRWYNAKQYRINGNDEKAFADAYRQLTANEYNNLLYDCLTIRNKYILSDWAYYKMLQALAETICGKDTNEALFLHGVLLNQSGYMIRFAIDPDTNRLHILVKINGIAYNATYSSIDGNLFFILDGSKPQSLEICTASFPGEKEMDLNIKQLPYLATDLTESRRIISGFASIEAEISVNKNMLDFFNDYPSTFCNNNIMTNWAYYANTPVTNEVREKLYPQLKERIKGTTKLEAANILLNWVQMGLEYAIDQKVWGRERAFFAEESLFYPKCDCEDRAILYSHLVRDILGLDVLLVYYPEHLYTAVCFNEDVEGDYFYINGRKFTVADPTYYLAKVGKTMNQMDNSKAKVILLDR
mgnify:CR=1 FL=1